MSVKLSSVSSVDLLAQPPEVWRHRDAPPALVVDPQHDDAEDGGGRGEDHHRGVVDTEDGRVVGGRDPAGHRHQEHRHVQHGGDTQGHLLSGLRRDQEDKTKKENCGRKNKV